MNNFSIGAEKATVFSSAVFCCLWAEVYGQKWHQFGTKKDLGAIYTQSTRLGLRRYELSPSGLYWGSNQDSNEVSQYFLKKVIRLSRQWNCLSLTWNFRYDAKPTLEQAKILLGPDKCKISEGYTHVLDLNGGSYDQVRQHLLKALTRKKIRIGINSELIIREITTQSDLDQHASIYQVWAAAKGIKPKPPLLIPKLANEMGSSSLFLGAFKQDKLMAAILLFRDQQEWFYWFGVRDIHQDKYFAMDVLFANVIQKACESGVRYFNMGGSIGIKSLEFFKERWGAEKRTVWTLKWENSYWSALLKLRKMIAI